MVSRPFDLGILAYPWDVAAEPESVHRLVERGITSVSVAAAYHSLRQLRPRPSGPVVVDEPDAALHWNPPATAFSGSVVQPVVVGSPKLPDALAALEDIPVRRYAWLAVLHSTVLARAHPELSLHIATGDRLAHALCPSRPEVIDYARRLVAAAGELDVDGLELEATGYHGWPHGARHDKAGIAVTRELAFLLSVCFCPGCSAAIRDAGADPEQTRGMVEATIRRRFVAPDRPANNRDTAAGSGSAPHPDPFWSTDESRVVLLARSRVVARMHEALFEAAAGRPVLVHGGTDPLQTGSRALVSPEQLPPPDAPPVGVVVSTDGLNDENAEQVARHAVAAYGERAWLSVRAILPDIATAGQLTARLRAIRTAGASGARLHTFGLWDDARLAWVGTSAEALKEASDV